MSDKYLLLTHKQYLISRNQIIVPYMHEYLLDSGVYLYVGSGLNVKFLTDSKNRRFVVLGSAYRVDDSNKAIDDEIKNFSGDDINELVYNWTGKWLIIYGTEIQSDAGGLMPVFYTNICLSSSIALLSSILALKPLKKVDNQGLEWQILPYTISEGIRAMLCTQKINITPSRISVLFNPWINDLSKLQTEEKVKRLSNYLKNALINISTHSQKDVWIALTGGKDSRLVLAAALASKIKFYAYTLEHSKISDSDRNIPLLLSKKFSFPYKYIKRGSFDKNKYLEYESFTAGNSRGVDLLFYSYAQFQEIPDNAIVIRSGLFEAGQHYARSIAGASLDSFIFGIKKYYKYSFKDSSQILAFDEWLNYVKDNPIDFIDLRDRMYLEQRVGGWLSAIEQSFDINKFDSIQVANSRAILSILLSADVNEREHLLLSYKSIEYLNKDLLIYPVNNKTLKDKVKLIFQVLLSPSRLKRYLHRFF